MNEQASWTIHRLLSWTADFFNRHQSDSPRLDAEILLSHSLKCGRIDLYTQFDKSPDAGQLEAFRALVKRRAAGEPVAYLVGRKEFYSLSFEVNPDVLIPRPETEQLVVEVLDAIRARPDWSPPRVVDVGTGSGVIAITLARHLPQAKIFAGDISDRALGVAAKNASRHQVEPRIEFRVGDLLAPFRELDAVHVIVSNPPYIGQRERSNLPHSVVDFEPALALFSTGPTGTEVIVRLIEQAAEVLTPSGLLVFEISPLVAAAVRAFLQESDLWADYKIKRDLAGLERVVIARRRS